jgi:dihydroflavonol-4-reductase
MTERDDVVLVTGGTGFLGGWCCVELLRRDHTVRTTIRDLARADDLRATFTAAGVEAGEQLSIVAADLSADEGWADAVAGCDYVLHVASPFPPAQPKDPDELIVPARDGALRVLRASLDAGVQRVVMTSSVAAVRHGREASASAPYNEADWTDPQDTRRTPYVRSKTVAERAAWDHVRAASAEDRLVTVNPGAIIGPVLSDDRSYSLQAIERLLNGMPAVPRLGFTFVDVRDVADLHIRAMTDAAAGGERFLAVDRFLWLKDVARILRERLGPAASKVPHPRSAGSAYTGHGAVRSKRPFGGERSWTIRCLYSRQGEDHTGLGSTSDRGLDSRHRDELDRARSGRSGTLIA